MFYKKAVVNSEQCEIFESSYFEEHLRTAAWKRIHETEKKKIVYIIFILKKQVKMLGFISRLVSFGVCIQIQYFCDVVRNKLQTINIYLT